MYSFMNDYSELAHSQIQKAVLNSAEEQNIGYGLDKHSDNAKAMIKKLLKDDSVDIHFLPGGTITNKTFISHSLRPYEAVISADTGHINVHETGAIEATGHKVIAVASRDGKVTIETIQKALEEHTDEHMVLPKMLYISNPTELGTIYNKEELVVLSDFCKERGLLFYLDGARLSMALAALEGKLTLEDIAKNTDAFYIGGTKVGAMFGEALVIRKAELKDSFRFSLKHEGGMMAKGFLIGIQFEEFFKKGLYFEIGKHANDMAAYLQKLFLQAGISLFVTSCTNQIFPILPNKAVKEVEKEYAVTDWGKADEQHSIIRFCTSFATQKEDIDRFFDYFSKLL